jgi:hypothetical protein
VDLGAANSVAGIVMASNDLLKKLNVELARLGSEDTHVELDDEFEPTTGMMVKLQIGEAYWHFLPGGLLELLQHVPDAAGADAIKKAVETRATEVWHGPSPEGSRDTSP